MTDVRPYLKIIDGTPTDSFMNDFNLFNSTEEKLLKTIFTNLKLEPSKEIKEDLEHLSKLIHLDLKKLEVIVKVGNSIFTQLERKKITLEEIQEDFDKLNLEGGSFEKVDKLYEDFGKDYAIKRIKFDTIKSNLYSLSPKITNILYELNIRAIESKEDESYDIIGQIPVACIKFESDLEGKDLHNAMGLDTKKFAFNATFEDLEKIIEDLNNIKLHLTVLSK